MGNDLSNRETVLTRAAKFGPEFCHPRGQIEARILERMQQTGTREPFGRRPDENHCIGGPWQFALGVSPAMVKAECLGAILPNSHRSTHFDAAHEVALKNLLNASGCGGVSNHVPKSR